MANAFNTGNRIERGPIADYLQSLCALQLPWYRSLSGFELSSITGGAFDIAWKIFVSFPLKKDVMLSHRFRLFQS